MSFYGILGVLQSIFHVQWFLYQSSSLKGDLRYTNSTVFETFPFPKGINDDVSQTMMKIENYRKKACSEYQIGLTDLYNQLKDGAHILLKKLHDNLDIYVANSYNYPKNILKDREKMIAFLMDLNHQHFNEEQDKIAI